MFEDLMNRLATGVLALPSPLVSLLAGRLDEEDEQVLDAQVKLLLNLMQLSGAPALHRMAVTDARALFEQQGGLFAPPPAEVSRIDDWNIPGPGGAELPVRLYTPEIVPGAGAAALPVLVYYHGGGWVIGSRDTHDSVAREFATKVGCIVASVDYRLAPEHRYPAAADDAVEAFLWAVRAAKAFGGDPDRVAIAGDSAGGNLAAVVSQRCRDKGEPQPCFQLLLYPVTDLSKETRSYEKFASGYYLERDTMRWFRAHYLGDGSLSLDPGVSPLLAESMDGLPPTLIMTAGFDVLRDEGKAYAERLLEAGVKVDYRNYPSLIHGFVSMGGSIAAAADAVGDAVSALKANFASDGK